jgi:hypothetical protein
MSPVFDLADCADAQLLQGLVIQLAAVVLAHARTRPDPNHKVNLLVNGLVRVLVLRRDPGAPTAGVDSAAMGNTAAV